MAVMFILFHMGKNGKKSMETKSASKEYSDGKLDVWSWGTYGKIEQEIKVFEWAILWDYSSILVDQGQEKVPGYIRIL